MELGRAKAGIFFRDHADSDDLSNIDDGEGGSPAPCAQLGASGSAGIDIKFFGITI